MPKFAGLFAAILLAGSCGSSDPMNTSPPASPPPPPPSPPELTLALRQVATGLSSPLLLTAPANDARKFVVEQGGKIRIIKNGALLPQPFLDIGSLISSGGERGLLGLAFHPRYASNGIFVVDYTDPSGDTRIATFHVSTDADKADQTSQQIVLTVDQPYANHNGGNVAFGPDGMLYVGMGDGGSGGDPGGRGQNKNDLLGSLLRLEILDNGTSRVPGDNPFVGVANAKPELWDLGLRNPWRFSFDRGTGDLYIADVGQGDREEINIATSASGRGRGLNYGWNIFEGTRCFGSSSGCAVGGMTPPVLEYTHSDGCSITGGFVYRGTAIPELVGTYFYADYCNGWVRSFKFVGGAVTAKTNWAALAPGGSIFSFGEDAAGEVYICSDGGVYQIIKGP